MPTSQSQVDFGRSVSIWNLVAYRSLGQQCLESSDKRCILMRDDYESCGFKGRKRWAMYPPGKMPPGVRFVVDTEDELDVDFPSCTALRYLSDNT